MCLDVHALCVHVLYKLLGLRACFALLWVMWCASCDGGLTTWGCQGFAGNPLTPCGVQWTDSVYSQQHMIVMTDHLTGLRRLVTPQRSDVSLYDAADWTGAADSAGGGAVWT
jgi:hypothetical protein